MGGFFTQFLRLRFRSQEREDRRRDFAALSPCASSPIPGDLHRKKTSASSSGKGT